MYIPDAFAVEATLHAFIAEHTFATLISGEADGLFASHVPMIHEPERKTLQFHVAAANPHSRLAEGERVLAIFSGPHGHVSPSWFKSQPAVPTWNYAAVHAYGHAKRLARERLRSLVARLVAAYEPRNSPWKMRALPAAYMEKMLDAIAGFEIDIERLEGKFKLSQNRGAADLKRIVAGLGESPRADDRALGEFTARHATPKD